MLLCSLAAAHVMATRPIASFRRRLRKQTVPCIASSAWWPRPQQEGDCGRSCCCGTPGGWGGGQEAASRLPAARGMRACTEAPHCLVPTLTSRDEEARVDKLQRHKCQQHVQPVRGRRGGGGLQPHLPAAVEEQGRPRSNYGQRDGEAFGIAAWRPGGVAWQAEV